MKMRAKASMRGSSSLFFVVVVLPLCFFLFTLSLDLTKYFRESQQVQKVLDDAALHSWKYLPYEDQARTAAESYLARYGSLTAGTTVRVTADELSLDIRSQSKLQFASYFLGNVSLPIARSAIARGTPFDTFIAFDRSAYLAPDSPFDAAWGDAGEWPALRFFATDRPFVLGGQTVDPRRLTQQCFNPLVSHLKQTAIAAYEYFAGFRTNSVGVGVFPGTNGASLEHIRPVQYGRTTVSSGGEAFFPPLNYILIGGDSLCAAAVEREADLAVKERYAFPTLNAAFPGLWQPPSQPPPSMTVSATWHFNPDYAPFFRASESIWTSVVDDEVVRGDELVWDAFNQVIPFLAAERKGLALSAIKNVIILAGDVPFAMHPTDGLVRFSVNGDFVSERITARLNGEDDDPLTPQTFNLRELLRQHPLLDVRFFYVVLDDPLYGPTDVPARVDQLRQFWSDFEIYNGERLENLRTEVVLVTSPDDFIRRVGGAIVLEGRGTVLAR